MSKIAPEPTVFTIGQLASRWGVSRDRVRTLVDAGHVSAFRIPSAGRFGETVKIMREEVERVEAEWAIAARVEKKPSPPKRRGSTYPESTHFPELNREPALDVESHASE